MPCAAIAQIRSLPINRDQDAALTQRSREQHKQQLVTPAIARAPFFCLQESARALAGPRERTMSAARIVDKRGPEDIAKQAKKIKNAEVCVWGWVREHLAVETSALAL
jgi:hypothetical protein